MTQIEVKQTGRVDRVIPAGAAKNKEAFGFIEGPSGRLFFRSVDCVTGKMPGRYAMVRYYVVAETQPGKSNRAIAVEPVEEPAPPA